ncbi:hypothetical protein PHPALM_9407 [Phytophthora palmivora]|uniref:Uncharacterized protein n=1 Tax=Phytophthora palmivora TaxID=4796 RepID=A0A2P4Y7D8_9STRA|nr:hypothetical protein PHPALM_9407 [Phytophthora palmivora]
MHPNHSIAKTFDVTPVPSRPVLAPRVPVVAALAAARRAPHRRKKLKWRTRDSQASQLYNLELDVMGLRQEIHRLMEYQQILRARTFNRRDALDGYYVKTIQEYHRVFENGYHPGAPIDAKKFVMEVMDENIVIGRFAGRDVMLHQSSEGSQTWKVTEQLDSKRESQITVLHSKSKRLAITKPMMKSTDSLRQQGQTD